MFTWLFLITVAILFVAINIIVGCYVTIRLGYGPPDWKTALNLVISVTAFQDCLNDVRSWLERKAPWADKLLDRLNVPKPIVIVEFPEELEEDEIVAMEATSEQANESGVPLEESVSSEQEAELISHVEPDNANILLPHTR